MRLHDLKPNPGSRHRRKIVGRGESSGRGKTSGRGGKGQSARSGSSMRPGFEGGQMPLIRRVPKRGFSNARFKTVFLPVNVKSLERFDDGAHVDEAALRAAGLANGPAIGRHENGIKILGDGKLTKKLHVVASAFSETARKAIEALGGTCQAMPRIPRGVAAQRDTEAAQAAAEVAAPAAEAGSPEAPQA